MCCFTLNISELWEICVVFGFLRNQLVLGVFLCDRFHWGQSSTILNSFKIAAKIKGLNQKTLNLHKIHVIHNLVCFRLLSF